MELVLILKAYHSKVGPESSFQIELVISTVSIHKH